MIFLYVEHGFPIVNASKLSSSTGWKKTTARLAQTNKSYWQRNMISSCTYSQQWNGFKTGFLHKQAGSDRGSIEVRSRSKRTTHPFSQRETWQQADPNSSRQQEEASSSMQTQQQAESSKQKMQKTAAAAAAAAVAIAAAAAAAAGRIQQEEERYCRRTSSQPERSVWHLQVWNYRTVQRHI